MSDLVVGIDLGTTNSEVAAFVDGQVKVLGPAEAPVPKLKSEFRYQLLLKAADRKRLNETLRDLQRFAREQKWPATALVIDVDPLTLM